MLVTGEELTDWWIEVGVTVGLMDKQANGWCPGNWKDSDIY